jgi:hypothetical protein
MSLSNPKLENPCKKFFEFKGDKGIFQYYDKETEKSIELSIPFYFIVLDELSTITGFNDENQSGIYSNEVHNITEEILRVKTFKGGISITGKYAEIKNDIKAIGGKFTKSVYAMLIKKDENEFVHFKFSGSSFAAWLEKKIDTQKFGIKVCEFKTGTKGKVTYLFPFFEKAVIGEQRKNIWSDALEMDKILQKYLTSYKTQQIEVIEVKQEAKEEQPDNFDFEKLQEVKEQAVKGQGNDTEDDLPF